MATIMTTTMATVVEAAVGISQYHRHISVQIGRASAKLGRRVHQAKRQRQQQQQRHQGNMNDHLHRGSILSTCPDRQRPPRPHLSHHQILASRCAKYLAEHRRPLVNFTDGQDLLVQLKPETCSTIRSGWRVFDAVLQVDDRTGDRIDMLTRASEGRRHRHVQPGYIVCKLMVS